MIKKKITAILVAVGMMVSVAAPTMVAHAETIHNTKVYAQQVNSSMQKAVINQRVAIKDGNNIVGYANQYDMAVIQSSNSGTYSVVTEFGLTGTIQKDALTIVASGVNQPLTSMNKDGHVSNVTTVLNVRSNASVQSSIMSQLTNNTNFKIVGKQGSWYKINVNGQNGFVYGDFVSEGHSSVGGQVLTGSRMKNTVSNTTSVTRTSTSNNGSYVAPITHKTSTVVNNNKETHNTTTPVEHNTSKTTPVEHNTNTTTPVEHNTNKTTPVEHNTNKTTPVEHNTNKTTPVEHDTNKTTPVEHNTNKTTPVEHDTNKTTPVQATYTYMPQLSQEVFNGISALRTEAGVSALTQSSSANSTAMALAKQMAEVGNADHSYNEMGAMCPEGNANYIVNMFKNSPEHYNELKNKLYTEAGVAVYKNNKTGEYFTAVKFIAPSTNGMHWHTMS